MRKYRGILVWTAVSLAIAIVLALGFGWWVLTYHPLRFARSLSADTAWMVARINDQGRYAAVLALSGAKDPHSRLTDPAWRALIHRKLHGSADEQRLMLYLVHSAFDYGEGRYEQGIDLPEHEQIGLLASSTDVALDPAVRLAARRCWRGYNDRMGVQAYRTTTALVISEAPVPDSPITPDGWRPGRLGLSLLRDDLLFGVLPDNGLETQVRERMSAVLGDLVATNVDRRDQVLLLSHLLSCQPSYYGEGQQKAWIAILMQRLMANDQWIDDIWERDTTTALLLARGDLLFRAIVWPEIRLLCDRFTAGTIRWCLAQDPHRLPEWRANGQVIPAGDLERFGAWLMATRQVFALHTWPSDYGVSSEIRALAMSVTQPVQVDVAPDPERCSPFGLSLIMKRLWSECANPRGPLRPEWAQWNIRVREWVEHRQIMTPNHGAPHGTWPARGEVDTVWETLFMCTIDE